MNTTPACLLKAWHQHESELRNWLRRNLPDNSDSQQDFLQEIFIKAMQLGSQFCAIQNPRAWLFSVARNHLIDKSRSRWENIELPDDITADVVDILVLDELTHCIPHVLDELSYDDREIIIACDINGETQKSFAEAHNISLAASKSRLQRARQHLKKQLTRSCQVKFDEHGAVCEFTPRFAIGKN